MREIFRYRMTGRDEHGTVLGRFEASGIRPHFMQELEDRGIKLAGRHLQSQRGARLMSTSSGCSFSRSSSRRSCHDRGRHALVPDNRGGAMAVNRRLRLIASGFDRPEVLARLRRDTGCDPLARFLAGAGQSSTLPAHGRVRDVAGPHADADAADCRGAVHADDVRRRHVRFPDRPGDGVDGRVLCRRGGSGAAADADRAARRTASQEDGRAISRRARHLRARPARRPSGGIGARTPHPGNDRPDRQRVRHRHRRSRLWRGIARRAAEHG